MGASADGYPDDPLLSRALLVVTHLGMIPSMWLAFRCRNQAPWVLIFLLMSFVSSAGYHLCYSFDVCAATDRRIMHKADLVASPMIVPALLTLFLWYPRPSPRTERLQRVTLADGAVPSSSELTWQARVAPDGDANEWGGEWASDDALQMYRPTFVEPLVLVLFIGQLLVEVAIGMDHYAAHITLAVGVSVAVTAHVSEAVVRGLCVDTTVAAAVLLPLAVACCLFRLDDVLGAAGHSMWHSMAFIATYNYMRFGPILRTRDGPYVRVAQAAPCPT